MAVFGFIIGFLILLYCTVIYGIFAIFALTFEVGRLCWKEIRDVLFGTVVLIALWYFLLINTPSMLIVSSL